MRSFLAGAITLAIVLAAGGLVWLKTAAHGFSARAEPSALETFAAEKARQFALPPDAKALSNPVALTNEVLTEAKAHWADHCATCHANDGSGQVPMGQAMYPPAPDMRKEGTQRKTDGELFYIIENGIRLSGMPAWGASTHAAHGQQGSWKLVRFIRHLPDLTPEEVKQMEALNPKTPADLEEEKQEEEFLKGGEHHH